MSAAEASGSEGEMMAIRPTEDEKLAGRCRIVPALEKTTLRKLADSGAAGTSSARAAVAVALKVPSLIVEDTTTVAREGIRAT